MQPQATSEVTATRGNRQAAAPPSLVHMRASYFRVGIFLLRRAWVLVEHTLLDQCLWRGPVGDLLVERIGTHVLRQLHVQDEQKSAGPAAPTRILLFCSLPISHQGVLLTSLWWARRLGAAVDAGRMFPKRQGVACQPRLLTLTYTGYASTEAIQKPRTVHELLTIRPVRQVVVEGVLPGRVGQAGRNRGLVNVAYGIVLVGHGGINDGLFVVLAHCPVLLRLEE